MRRLVQGGTDTKIAEWKTKRGIAKLQDRAEIAVDYAAAARDVAAAALDEAKQASGSTASMSRSRLAD